ncbi:hypothetical protein BDZ89DRAFT_152730 [Hymenopellis radicata]|nr:hypothetical protein BDZ89DRAFT_152730 [Hymenopellis radicata]
MHLLVVLTCCVLPNCRGIGIRAAADTAFDGNIRARAFRSRIGSYGVFKATSIQRLEYDAAAGALSINLRIAPFVRKNSQWGAGDRHNPHGRSDFWTPPNWICAPTCAMMFWGFDRSKGIIGSTPHSEQ